MRRLTFDSSRRSWRRACALVILAVAVAACGGDGGGEPPPVAASLLPAETPTALSGVVGAVVGDVRVRAVDAQGAAVRGAVVTWTPSAGAVAPTSATTDAAGVATTAWTLGTVAGSQTLRATVTGGSAVVTFVATATPDGPAAVVVSRDTSVAPAPGAIVRFSAAVRDRYGNDVATTVRWSTSDASLATIDSLGALLVRGGGAVTVTATAGTVSGQVALTIAGPAALALGSVPADTLRPGANVAIDGTGFVPLAMTATVAGVPAVVTSVTATRLVVGVPSPAVLPCTAPSAARIVVRRQLGAVVDSVVAQAPLDPATARALQPGERVVADDGAGLRCTRLESGGRYVVSVFNTSTAAPGGVAVQLRGTAVGTTLAARLPRQRAAVPSRAPTRADRAGVGAPAHADHLDRERIRLRRLGARLPNERPNGAPSLRAAAAPAVGDVVTLNAMYFDCATPTAVRARVAAVGMRSAILEDEASAGAGTRDAIYRQIADEFDRVMYPIVTQHFGDPLALDARFAGDGRVRMLFTPYVADSVPNTIGFVTGCNFAARATLPSSNEAAVFYARLPNTFETPAEWQRNLRATLVHETKHLAAYAERFARASAGEPVLEETWLEESTARVAEELYARTFSGATWKGNAAYAPTVGCELTRCDGRPIAMSKHFDALGVYYSRVDSLTPIGRTSAFDGTFYGSGWMLVRWAADQFAADEPSFFRALTTEVGATGLTNLARRTGRAAPAMLADWSLALAVDDRPGFTPRAAELTIPSWNTRDVFRGLSAYNPFQFPRPFPLLVRTATFGDFVADVPLLRSWTAAYVEITGPLGTRQLLSVQGPTSLGMAIVRIE